MYIRGHESPGETHLSRKPASDQYEARRKALLESEKCLQPRNCKGVFETVLAYPSSYAAGMSSLGFQKVFSQLCSWPDTICERAFMPEADEIAWRRRTGRPVVTLETGRSIRNCDLLAFSIAYELDYLNALVMLSISGIAPKAADRPDNWPIVIAGGLCLTANPMPMAQFFDAIAIGESEPSLGPMLDTIKSLGSQGAGKKRILKMLSVLPGIYVPSIHGFVSPKAAVMRQWASAESLPVNSCFVAPGSALGDLMLLEISRGCPFNCRFCLPGYAYLPYREARIEDLQQALESLPKKSRVGIVACSPDSHPQFSDLVTMARRRGHEVSIGSQRAEEPLQGRKSGFKGTTLTIAPETGSDSLRKVVGKSLKNDAILRTIDRMARKVSRIKLYFIYGFPFETDEDRESIPLLIKEIRSRTKLPLSVSINPFVPKPWTAFQWMALADPRLLRKWRDEISRALRRVPGLEVRFLGAREAHIQALLARGDHRVADVLMNALSGNSWSTAFSRAGIDMGWVLTPLKPGAPFEWDFLNMGFGHTRLARELGLAISANQARLRPSSDRSSAQVPAEAGSQASCL